MKKQLTDSEILSNVLEVLRYSANEMATKLGYKSASSVYNVIKEIGGAKISINMADKIVEKFPEVNYLYLTRGEEPILLDNSQTIGQNHILNWEKEQLGFDSIPQTLKNIEELLIEIRDKMNTN